MAMTTGKETGMMFRVSVEGLPDIIMVGRSPGAIKAALRKIVKQPSMINDVERMPRAKVKKLYRDLGQGKEEEKVEESTVTENKEEILERAQDILAKRKERLEKAKKDRRAAWAQGKKFDTLKALGYHKQPEWGTPESTRKAKKQTPGEKN